MLHLMSATSVAFDVGPLAGQRTGIGTAVSALRDALGAHDEIELIGYLTSFRARPTAGERRLPLPAAAAHRLWGAVGWPRADRWLRPAQVIHGTNYVVPPSRLPRIVSVYDCWFLQHGDQAHAEVRRAGRVLRRAIGSGAVVHASSHATATVVEELFPGATVEVIHLAPIALPPIPAMSPVAELDGCDYVLAVSTLERRKNLPRLVEAFGQVAEAVDDVRLVLAGADSDDRGAIEAAIDALPPEVSARVLLTGFVDDDARSWLLHHARVLAYPSLDEGFGFPLLDAMQARLPIVASRAGSIPEVVGDSAILVDAHDTEGLAGALVTGLTDDARRVELIAAGSAQLASFSWAATATKMADLYVRMAGAGA